MKRVYVNEDRCLACHLCEYYCSFANSGETDMAKAFKLNRNPVPRITVEEHCGVSFAVQCRQCTAHPCVDGCITGALSYVDGIIRFDKDRCVGCYTCVMSCPYGCIVIDEKNGGRTVTKCELCTQNSVEQPACVTGCINGALVYEERGEA